MLHKIDKNLLKIITQSAFCQSVNCFAFVKNIEQAKKLVNKNFECKITGEYPFIQALSITISSSKVLTFAKYDDIIFLSPQTKVSTLVNVSKNVLNFKNSCSNNEITTAIIDTGISPHLDFTLGKNRISKFVDLINGKDAPYDDNGHGTFVAGVLAGSGIVSNKKYSGFAPQTNLIIVKALNEKGEANATKILDAMQWIYENAEKQKIKVVCMSFGSEPLGFSDPIMKGAEALWHKGIFVVCAGGNSGPDFATIKSPGTSSKVITVGGLDDGRVDGQIDKLKYKIADFSSRGPSLGKNKPDVVAPAVKIISCCNKSFYTELSGTSVSTPMIAGIAVNIL
ncbi:MAG: S8 family peptidase, partial [Clostridia bacterium]